MTRILCIETSTKNCSVSLVENGSVIAYREEYSSQYTHSEKLHIYIHDVFAECTLELSHLDAICVGKGPGSFTGLRIGVATAKGLCYGADLPLLSIDSLEIMSQSVLSENGVLFPMIDARRLEVYTAVFSSEKKRLKKTQSLILPEAGGFFEKYSDKKGYFFGDGAYKAREFLSPYGFEYIEGVHPSARFMNKIAQRKFDDGDFSSLSTYEPFYLKDFVMRNN